MHLIYLDESGVSEMTPDQPFYFLTAVVVPENIWHALDASLRHVLDHSRSEVLAEVLAVLPESSDVAKKWLRKAFASRSFDYARASTAERKEAHQAVREWLDNKFELHAEPLWNGRDVYLGVRKATRMKILDEVFRVLEDHRPQILSVGLDKAAQYERCGDPRMAGHAFSLLVERLDSFLQLQGPHVLGMLIADRGGSDQGQVTRLLRNFQRQGTFLINKRIRSVIDNLHFVESVNSPAVQVADICGYFLRRGAQGDRESGTWQRRVAGLNPQIFRLP